MHNGIVWRSFEASKEWGVQFVVAQNVAIDDNSERRMELGRYQLCVLASATRFGVVVEGGGCKGYQSYGIVIICFKHNHMYVVLCSESRHNVWLNIIK